MKERRVDFLAKVCEKLPLNITFFENNGFCERAYPECQFAQKVSDCDNHLCTKKTYTPLQERVFL